MSRCKVRYYGHESTDDRRCQKPKHHEGRHRLLKSDGGVSDFEEPWSDEPNFSAPLDTYARGIADGRRATIAECVAALRGCMVADCVPGDEAMRHAIRTLEAL